jgi:glycosyltransferase involved in cell wall biosynthesis
MRLCFIADADNVHTRRWVTPLIERGHATAVYSYKPVTRPWDGVELTDLTQLATVPKVRFAFWGLWLRQRIRAWRPDVLHVHQLQGAGWLGVLAGFRPMVASAWGSDLLVEPGKSRLRRWLVEAVMRRSAVLTVPSTVLREAALALGVDERKVRVVPWGVETAVFRPEPDDRVETRRALGIPQDAPVVLSVRRLTSLYNHDVALEAVARTVRAVPRLRYVILRFTPDPGHAEEVEATVARLGLADVVQWIEGGQSMERMAQLYRASDATLSIPSSEGYGSSVYEAMASGCPVVMSDLPVFAHLRDKAEALKVPVRDVARTSDALVRALLDHALAGRLRENALRIAAGHSVEARVEAAERIYRDLGGTRGSP